ncbi:MAG: cupin domain-containing protein [Hyphomicrobiaceae bacterium]
MTFQLIDHESQAKDVWRQGVMTRMIASAVSGTRQLCIFEQWCDPGLGAPAHLHAVEEILTVLEGEAEIWVETEHHRVTAGQSAIIPAGRRHGFSNMGKGVLRVQATLASPVFEAAYDDKSETPRRWLPGA